MICRILIITVTYTGFIGPSLYALYIELVDGFIHQAETCCCRGNI
jgi:hypothetical protein